MARGILCSQLHRPAVFKMNTEECDASKAPASS